jgi:hypothetical protein
MAASRVQDLMIGVKIYSAEKDLVDLSGQWQSLGFNTVFLGENLISSASFQGYIDSRSMTTFLIVPIFHNPEFLELNPGYAAITGLGTKAQEDWLAFVCPSTPDYRRSRVEYIRDLIERFKPDGISLDFIRHYIYWEKVYPQSKVSPLTSSCFDSTCIHEFEQRIGIKIPDSLDNLAAQAHWIVSNCLQEWTEWKCQTITGLVRDICTVARQLKPDILVNVHAVPWRSADFDGAIKSVVGQDFVQISKYVDYLSPMCYSHMAHRPPEWIHSVVADIHRGSGCQVVPSIQVKEHYRTEPFTTLEFERCLSQALSPPSQGVVFWSWEALKDDLPGQELIARTLL